MDPYYGSGTVLYLATRTYTSAPRPAPTYVPAALASSWARAWGAGDSPVGSGRRRPYGTSLSPSILPNSLLIFDVEVAR